MTEKFFKLKLHPKSGARRIKRKGPDSFEIWVKAKAERGLANKEAFEILAKELNINPKKIFLVKGAASPSKIVKIL